MTLPALSWISEELAGIEERNLFRRMRVAETGCGPRMRFAGRDFINFASNNYLGLAEHPRVIAAVKRAVAEWGWGAGASQLISGNTRLHRQLCARLAALEQTEDAVLFASGFHANIGTVSALAGAGDRVIIDKLSHASIVDGARLSSAEVRVYPHCDMNKLSRLLSQTRNRSGAGYGRTLVVTDSVFSMDGDLAPLAEIADLCDRHEAMLMVDEAHATGVLGAEGSGALEELGLKGRVPVVMGTLSKALGGIGGFIAGSRELCDFVRNRVRSAIYTTALPPAAAAGALAALELVVDEPWRRRTVLKWVREMRENLEQAGVETIPGPAAIVPVIVGNTDAAMAAEKFLADNGIMCPAIRPPTVAPGTCRLRLSLMATHGADDVQRVAEVLRKGVL